MSEHLVNTPATPTVCPRCQRLILAAIAEGIPARVDVTALDQGAEITALLEGRWTYTFTAGELVHRDATRIAGRHLRGPVLAEHRCPKSTPTDHPPF